MSCCAGRWPRPRAIRWWPPRSWGCNAPLSTACVTPSASANPTWIPLVSERIQAPGATSRAPTGTRPAPARGACAPPQTRCAPRPPARRRPAVSHGASAQSGMDIAQALDSANAEVPSPARGGGRGPLSQRSPDRQEGSVCKSRLALRPEPSPPTPTRRWCGFPARLRASRSRPTSRPDEMRRRDSPRVNASDRAWPQQSASLGRGRRGSHSERGS